MLLERSAMVRKPVSPQHRVLPSVLCAHVWLPPAASAATWNGTDAPASALAAAVAVAVAVALADASTWLADESWSGADAVALGVVEPRAGGVVLPVDPLGLSHAALTKKRLTESTRTNGSRALDPFIRRIEPHYQDATHR